MNIKKIKKSQIVLLVVMMLLLCQFGCSKESDPFIHEGYEEYETIIYDELSDYIRMAEPKYDESQRMVSIDVFFNDSYLNDDIIVSQIPEYEIVDRYMYLFNAFIQNNTSYFFGENNYFYITFYEDAGDHYDVIAELSNYTSTFSEGKLCSVNYHCVVDYKRLTCKEDIEFISINYYEDASDDNISEYISGVLELFPNIKRVVFSYSDSDDLIFELLKQKYPELEFGY